MYWMHWIVFSIDRPKDAIRAVKKRLNGNKNYREVMLTLTVSSYFFKRQIRFIYMFILFYSITLIISPFLVCH